MSDQEAGQREPLVPPDWQLPRLIMFTGGFMLFLSIPSLAELLLRGDLSSAEKLSRAAIGLLILIATAVVAPTAAIAFVSMPFWPWVRRYKQKRLDAVQSPHKEKGRPMGRPFFDDGGDYSS
jgi:hypothetical protein